MGMVHVAATPDDAAGIVRLRVSASGSTVRSVQLYRRVVGSTELVRVIPPGSYLDVDSGILLVSSQAVFDDTTAPLNSPFEYLAAPVGEDPVTASDQVTLSFTGNWWLGDPLRPHLDLSVVMRNGATPCSGTRAIYFLGVSALDRDGRSIRSDVPSQTYQYHTTYPMGAPSGILSVATRQLPDKDDMNLLFDSGDILLLRAPLTGGYGFTNLFLSIARVQEARLVSDHRVPWRRFNIQFQVVGPPAGGAYATDGTSWGDLCDGAYATLADMLVDSVSWATIAAGIPGGVFPSVWRTCTEVDATWATCAALAATGLDCTELVTGV